MAYFATNKKKDLSVYIDTNVLRNYCTKQTLDYVCLSYVFSVRRREKLFTSTLAIGQTLSGLQKSRSNKTGLSKEETVEKGHFLLHKITLIDFSEKDVNQSFLQTGNDVEDNIHYVLSQKKDCKIIITNDIKGFRKFDNIIVVSPLDMAYLKKLIS